MSFTDDQKEEILQHLLTTSFSRGTDPRPLAGQHVAEHNGGDLFQKAILEAFRYATIVQMTALRRMYPDVYEIWKYWQEDRHPEPEENKCTHTEHCCFVHGCKYCEDNCPVVTRQKKQSHPCMDCEDI